VLNLEMDCMPGDQPGVPAGPLTLVHHQERPAVVLSGADTAGPAKHLLDGGHINRLQANLGVHPRLPW
jgi:hypothetical protein